MQTVHTMWFEALWFLRGQVRREEGQTTVAESGSYPTMRDVGGPTVPDGAPVVFPDWAAIGQDQDTLLSEYQKLFGG